MTEVSNAVKVLIARMESHPDDFSTYGLPRGKFAGTAESLYGLCGLDEEKKNAFWFLNDTDKQALIEAWKEYHRKQHEKEVMEIVFDEDYYERQYEQKMVMQRMQQQALQQQMAQQNAALQGQTNYYNNAQNAASQGFLGGIFGNSNP